MACSAAWWVQRARLAAAPFLLHDIDLAATPVEPQLHDNRSHFLPRKPCWATPAARWVAGIRPGVWNQVKRASGSCALNLATATIPVVRMEIALKANTAIAPGRATVAPTSTLQIVTMFLVIAAVLVCESSARATPPSAAARVIATAADVESFALWVTAATGPKTPTHC